jgi:ABC-type transport system involved in cytochrome bd biosynthesis fused ATPase/permease subunit
MYVTDIVKMDGTDIRMFDLKMLREQISYVPQDVFLFSETVTGNIGFGVKDAEMTAVEKAARQASVDKEIAGFPLQYETLVGERGVTLSGGQKQRISIARALVKDPGLVIFDDCLSAVDARTEKEIIGHLNEYLHDKTAIIITHRIFPYLSLTDRSWTRVIVKLALTDCCQKGYYAGFAQQARKSRGHGREFIRSPESEVRSRITVNYRFLLHLHPPLPTSHPGLNLADSKTYLYL